MENVLNSLECVIKERFLINLEHVFKLFEQWSKNIGTRAKHIGTLSNKLGTHFFKLFRKCSKSIRMRCKNIGTHSNKFGTHYFNYLENVLNSLEFVVKERVLINLEHVF